MLIRKLFKFENAHIVRGKAVDSVDAESNKTK